jgi:hypothetical protein
MIAPHHHHQSDHGDHKQTEYKHVFLLLYGLRGAWIPTFGCAAAFLLNPDGHASSHLSLII